MYGKVIVPLNFKYQIGPVVKDTEGGDAGSMLKRAQIYP
jgi:hypothetical protein